MAEELMSDLYKKKAEQEKKDFFSMLKDEGVTLEQYIKKNLLIKKIFKIVFVIGFVDFISGLLMSSHGFGIIVYIIAYIVPSSAFLGILGSLLKMWPIYFITSMYFKNKAKKAEDYNQTK